MTDRENKSCWKLLAIVIVGLMLRVAAIFVLHPGSGNDLDIVRKQAIEHRQLAMNLVENGVFYFRDFDYYGPSSVQSPPYPFLLATCFKLFGADTMAAYRAAMIVNALASAVTIFMLFKLIRALGGSEIVALVGSALLCVWPSQIYATTQPQAISLITLCFVTILYSFQRSVSTGKLAPWIGYSLVGTLAALTEPVLLPMLALSGLLILVWRGLTIEQRLRNAAVLFAAAVVVIMPWSIRNHTVHGQWVPIKSTFWVNVWKGNNPNATGTDRLEMTADKKAVVATQQWSITDAKLADPKFDAARQYDMLTADQRARLKNQPEAAREAVFREFAKSWISEHPDGYLKMCAKRLGMTLWVDLDNPKARSLIYIATRSVLLPLSLVGLVIAIKRKWSMLFPVMLIGSCILTYALTVTANRFSLPFEPLQLGFVALVVVSVLSRKTTQHLT